jgi:hypothetical protein
MHLLLTTMPFMIFPLASAKMLLPLAIPPSLILFLENAIYFLSFDFMFFYCLYLSLLFVKVGMVCGFYM